MLQLPKQIGHIKSEIPIKIFILLAVFFLALGVIAIAQDAPTDITLNKDNIDEHCPTGTLIGNFSAVDVDGGTHFWSLEAGAGSSGNMSFDIPNGSSALYSDDIFNYESQISFTIRVQVRDENNAIFSKSFTININDIDEANLTSTVALSSESIDEDNDIGDPVGTLITNGVHAGTNHTYSLVSGSGSTNNASFSISGDQLLAAEVFDEDVKNTYSIRVRSDSQEGDIVFREFQSIAINRVNNEPTDITLTDNSFEEDQSIGYRVGFLNTTDLDDDGETYTYSFAAGAGDDDNANFEILSSQFRLATTFDYETQTTHSVRIRTEDGNGGSFERALTILVENSLFEPITDIFLSASDIDEENDVSDVIGTLSSEDDDAGDVHTYTLRTIDGSTDHEAFSISDDNLTAAVKFDFETQDSYTIRIRSNDGTGFFLDEDFTITINDIVEPIVWDGAWSNGSGPTFADNVVLDADYDVGVEGIFLSDNLTINSGSALTVDGDNVLTILGDVLVNGSFTVLSGSSVITYEGHNFIGFAFIRRTSRYGDGKYSFVGSPTNQNNSNTADNLGVDVDDVYSYDETVAFGSDGISRWITAGTEQLVPGKGYAQANKQNLFFIGDPNTGTITVSGTYTEDTDDANEGWNLIANPYAASIDVGDFLTENTNIAGAVYIWDDNGSDTQRGTNADYIVANGSMATNVTAAGGQTRYNNYLGSAQGFFVKLNNAADTDIDFTESMREGVAGRNSDENFFRETELPIVRLNLINSDGIFKQAVIGFAEDANENEMNRAYDAQAFNASANIGLFTMKAGRALALNGMPNDWEKVQLQLNIEKNGLYTIDVELEDYEGSLYLRDNLTEKIIDLRGESYSFISQTGIETDRFELISNPLNVLGLEGNEAFVYAIEGVLHIHQNDNLEREYQLFNMDGKKLWAKSMNSKSEINLSTYEKGIYLIFDGQKTHKIILD